VLVATGSLYAMTVIGITVGYHRHFTHRAFDAPSAVRVGLAVLGSMAAQGPLLFWVASHRVHHQFSDRAEDPHSPVASSLWHAHVGWMLDESTPDLGRYALDLLRDRLAMRMHASYAIWMAVGVALPAVACGIVDHSAASAALGALWGGLVRIFLAHHVTWSVNSICHRWGARPNATRDQSRNNWLVALFAFGEGWHNNHHALPTSARHGFGTWQPDASWWTIRALSTLGLAYDVKLPANRKERAQNV
jgi:stearoyl-CoA desaturase (delta-9 desaturase)